MNNIPYTCVLALMLATMSMGLQAEAQTVVLDTSNVVVGYHYSCNTKDAEGRAAIDEYDIALLIGKKIVAQKGFCELSLDEDEIYTVLDVIENYWARRIISNYPANALQKMFSTPVCCGSIISTSSIPPQTGVLRPLNEP